MPVIKLKINQEKFRRIQQRKKALKAGMVYGDSSCNSMYSSCCGCCNYCWYLWEYTFNCSSQTLGSLTNEPNCGTTTQTLNTWSYLGSASGNCYLGCYVKGVTGCKTLTYCMSQTPPSYPALSNSQAAALCGCSPCISDYSSCPNSLSTKLSAGGTPFGSEITATKSGNSYSEITCYNNVWTWTMSDGGCTYVFTNSSTGCPSSTAGAWTLQSSSGSGCHSNAVLGTITTT
jgi:hypothetical protein